MGLGWVYGGWVYTQGASVGFYGILCEAPQYLLLHLRRFRLTQRGYEKNGTAVELQENLMLQEQTDTDTWINEIHFKMIGKVNHIGRSMHSGHYNAEVLVDTWQKCNDSAVTVCGDMRGSSSAEVYLVCYERVRNQTDTYRHTESSTTVENR